MGNTGLGHKAIKYKAEWPVIEQWMVRKVAKNKPKEKKKHIKLEKGETWNLSLFYKHMWKE